MARSRNIKPGFFKNEQLAECEPLARILFEGLWCEADREGRLEDRPKRIKAECLPYDDCDVNSLLAQLERHGFIVRYVAGGGRYIAIPKFTKHQMPHHKELASVIPPPDGQPAITRHAYDVSNELRQAIFDRDGRRCLACGSTDNLSLDHIKPLAKGGDNDESNLQTLCKRCNSAKGDTTKSYVGATLDQHSGNEGAPCLSDSPFLIPDSPSPLTESMPSGMAREGPTFDVLDCPPEVNREAWADWVNNRRERRKPVSKRAAHEQWRALSGLSPPQQAECIAASIRNDWTGLFPEKFGGRNVGSSNRLGRDPTEDRSAAGQVRAAVARSRAERLAGGSGGDGMAVDGIAVRTQVG